MGTKYPTRAISGYNATPPADDGTAVEANRTTWAKHKSKLGDPVKTLAEAINTAMVAYVSQETVDKSSTFTTTTAEHKKTINVTGAYTQSLGDAGTMGTSYMVTIKNSHTAAITVDLDTGADTLDGSAGGSMSLQPKQSVTFITNAAADGYYAKSKYNKTGDGYEGGFPAGTDMLFYQTAAPTGWTKNTDAALNDHALRIMTSGAWTGGTQGTTAFSTQFAQGFGGENYTLLEADIPAHTHTAAAYTLASGDSEGVSGRVTGDGTTGSYGGGGAHAHDVNLGVKYLDMIIASKD